MSTTRRAVLALVMGVGLCALIPTASARAQEPARRVVPQDTMRRRQLPVRRDRAERPAARDSALADSAAVAFPEVDSIMRALLERPGFVPTQYRAETAVRFDAPNRAIELWNHARITRLGDRLDADSIVYVDTANLVTAYAPVTLTNAEGQIVTADSVLVYHTATRRSTLVGAKTAWGEWFVAGDATLEGRDTLWVSHGSFTSCDLEVPHYHFAADRMKLVLGRIVVAWPVRLYFGDVPVFWFPFFAQDIRRGRHSGILPVRFGVNDIVRQSRGHRRSIENVGYYWAINDYMDAQANLDWISGIYTKVDGYFRYNWRRQFLSGNLGYSHTFRQPSGRVLSLTWSHSHRLSERSDFRTSVQYTSNAAFVRSTTRDPIEAVQEFRSDAAYNRRFDWGTLSLGGQRVQSTSGDRVTWSAPNVSLTLTPLNFLRGVGPGVTWSGSARFNQAIMDQDTLPDTRRLDGSVSSGLTFGPLQVSSSASYAEDIVEAPDLLVRRDTIVVNGDTVLTFPDTVLLGPSAVTGLGNWSVSLGYRQRLVGVTTLTPALVLSGNAFRSRQTALDLVSGPTRLSARANLSTELYGFFPGVGAARRIRHKISPAVSWAYSPAVRLSDALRALRGFPAADAEEQHRITLGLSQTFEAKLRPSVSAERDTAVVDSLAAAEPEERKLTLLAIQTSALVYDFVRARSGESGLITDRLSNTLTSDLLRGFQVRMEHDLFEEAVDGSRDFDPFLSALNLSFSVGGGGGGVPRDIGGGLGGAPGGLFPDLAEPGLPAQPPTPAERTAAAGGPWNLSVNYSLLRTRPTAIAPDPQDRQTVNAGLSFQPTPNWRAQWTTTYDFEQSRFLQHYVSLQRDLHDWIAQFRFTRTVAGNFSFDFTVSLIPAPDIKFDYRQQSLPAALTQ